MSGIARNALRLRNIVAAAPAKLTCSSSSGSSNVRLVAAANQQRALFGTFQRSQSGLVQSLARNSHRHPCACVSCRFNHNKGESLSAEKELVEFLAEEIVAEKKALNLKTIPTEFEGFKVSLDGAIVTLTKKQDNEQITISFNINHTVDAEEEPELDPRADQPEVGQMKSKPNFDIEIKRGGQTLLFNCSFSPATETGETEEFTDAYGIEEISLYEGEHSDKVYAVGGDIIDGYLYDLLMNYLEEKGITNEFSEKLIELSTSYEHTAYIGLLEGLSKFTSK